MAYNENRLVLGNMPWAKIKSKISRF